MGWYLLVYFLVVIALLSMYWRSSLAWLFLFPLCLGLTWLLYFHQPDSPPPAEPGGTGKPYRITFEKPPAGKGSVYSLEEIRWCLREDIILEEMQGAISTQKQVDIYNSLTDAYNERCLGFRYRNDDLKRAQHHVRTVRDEIIASVRRQQNRQGNAGPAGAAAGPLAAMERNGSFHGHGRHDYNAAALCGRTPTRAIAPQRAQSVWRRVDDQGVAHFSQQGGAGAEYIGDRYKTQERLFDLNVAFSGGRSDPLVKETIYRNAYRVYDRLKELIDRPHWRRVSLDILLYGDRAEFEATLRKEGFAWAGAFFSGRENRVHMLLTPQEHENMLAVARHEISHALLAGMVGPTPIWLNEGLAEYMEHSGREQTATTPGIRGVDDLETLLAMSRERFYSGDVARNYRNAHTLIRRLMGQTEGKRVISHFLNELAADPCKKLDSRLVMARAYPGGLDRLARIMQL